MKRKIITVTLIAITLLLLWFVNQNQPKEVLFGTTKGIMSKSTLPVDIEYTSKRVEIDEVSQVNITLLSPLKEGVLNVKVRDLKDSLDGLDEEEFNFILTENLNRFNLAYEVSSKRAGIHYVNLMLTIKERGSKVLAVPVYIGNQESLQAKAQYLIRDAQGVPLSISKAEELKK